MIGRLRDAASDRWRMPRGGRLRRFNRAPKSQLFGFPNNALPAFEFPERETQSNAVRIEAVF